MHGGDIGGGLRGPVLTTQPEQGSRGFGDDHAESRRPLAGAAVGLAAGAVVLIGRIVGIIEGWPAAVLLVAALLAIPSARSLSLRIVVMGTLLYGWVSMLWWWPWPLGLERTDLLLAVAVGLAVGWAAGRGPSSLLPSVGSVDVLPWLGGLAALLAARQQIQARTPVDALAALLSGWDNAAHYAYIESLRRVGSTARYEAPQGFDAYVGLLMEIVDRSPGRANHGELLLAAHAQGWAVVIGIMVLVAAVCSVTRERRSLGLPAFASALAVTFFLAGPGGTQLVEGFRNFWTVNVAVAALVGLALVVRQTGSTVFIAMAGSAACVSAANGWPPMLALALPPALVICLGAVRALGAATWWNRLGYLMAFVVGFLGAGRAFYVLRPAAADPSSYTVPTDAGYPTSNPSLILGIVLAGIALLLLGGAPRPAKLFAWLGTIPLSGAAAATVLAWMQLQEGRLSYYFFKFVTGVELVTFVVLCMALVGLGSLVRVSARWLRPALVGAAAASLVAFTGSATGWGDGPLAEEPSTLLQSQQVDTYAQTGWSAAEIIAASELNSTGETHVGYLAFAGRELQLPVAEDWFRALTSSFQSDASRRIRGVLYGLENPQIARTHPERLAVLEAVLEHDPTTVVIVPPRVHGELVSGLDDDEERSRVITWTEP
jgi:hypothetical protein